MRDPNRIDEICDLLREVWKKYPDWRLGQLIFNLTGSYDCFYVEDDVLEEALKMNLQKE
jgi:uncharacterized protein YihD (DUF1040 family)